MNAAEQTEQVLTLAAQVLLGAATLPATWFALAYYRRSNWSASRTGKGLMAHSAILAVILDLSLVFAILSITGGIWAYALAVVLYGLLNWALWYQVGVLRRAQRADQEWRDDPSTVGERDDTLPTHRRPE